MPTADHRVFLTHSQTGEVRALGLAEAQVLRRELWPTALYSHRAVWEPTSHYHRAHLLAVDPDGDSWAVEEIDQAMQSADPATVARIAERGFDYRPDLAA